MEFSLIDLSEIFTPRENMEKFGATLDAEKTDTLLNKCSASTINLPDEVSVFSKFPPGHCYLNSDSDPKSMVIECPNFSSFFVALPEEPGIYLVYSKSSLRVIYIGKTINLKRRWTNHERLADMLLLTGQKNFLLKIIFCDPNQLNIIEKKFIQLYNPVLNKHYV